MAAFYKEKATPIYEAYARLLFQLDRSPWEQVQAAAKGEDFAATQAQALYSASLMRDALEARGLTEAKPVEIAGLMPWQWILRPTPPQGTAIDVGGLLMIMDAFIVKQVPHTDVVDVRFRSADPKIAEGLVEEIVARYKDYLKTRQIDVVRGDASLREDVVKLQEELWKAQAEEEALAQKFGPKHPDVMAAHEKIANWERLVHERTRVPIDPVEIGQDLYFPRGGVKLKIVQGTTITPDPVWPNPLILYPVAAVFGLFVGFCLVTRAERSSHKLSTALDLESTLGVHICGQIPMMGGSGADYRAYRCVANAPDSQMAQPFHALAAGLLEDDDSDRGRIIQVTGVGPRAGTTTIAANLAAALAASGKRVAVVDADLRQGTLHRVFDVSVAKGLTSILLNGNEIDDHLQTSRLSRVDVLSKGPRARNPLHLLAQPEVEGVLEILRQRYDVVLVDTPPLLALSDASLMATTSDVVLLVVRAARGKVATIRRALDMLDSVGAKTVGIVLNGAQLARCPAPGNGGQRNSSDGAPGLAARATAGSN